VQRLAHTVAARLAAALLAIAFSGAVQAVPADPHRPHRCECRAHGERHVCACPICNAAARVARAARARGEAAALPPCHRAAAERAEATARAAEERRGEGACLVPSCGMGERDEAASRAAEPFPVPASPRLVRVEWSLAVAGPTALALAAGAGPELPPPRRS
jgi:hypothetical protein